MKKKEQLLWWKLKNCNSYRSFWPSYYQYIQEVAWKRKLRWGWMIVLWLYDAQQRTLLVFLKKITQVVFPEFFKYFIVIFLKLLIILKSTYFLTVQKDSLKCLLHNLLRELFHCSVINLLACNFCLLKAARMRWFFLNG